MERRPIQFQPGLEGQKCPGHPLQDRQSQVQIIIGLGAAKTECKEDAHCYCEPRP